MKDKIKELLRESLLPEADNRNKIIKFGGSQELANWAHNISDKFSVWIANAIMQDDLDIHSTHVEDLIKRFVELLKIQNRPPIDLKTTDVQDARITLSMYNYIKDWVNNPDTPPVDLRGMTWEQAQRLSQEWHEDLKAGGEVEGITKDAELVHKFPNDYAWYLTKSERCDASQESMGHCATASRQDMYLLRLIKGNEEFVTADWHPTDKYIIQIKGKANKKPVPKYHPYIEWLIKSDMVKELKTNEGYKPETNFQITDLSPEGIADIIKIKPNLITSEDLLKLYENPDFRPIMMQYMNGDIVLGLIKASPNKRALAGTLGPENLNKLLDYQVLELLLSTSNKEGMASLVGQENIDKLTGPQILKLFLSNTYLGDTKKLIEILGVENVNKLTDFAVRRIIDVSSSREEAIEVFRKVKRPDPQPVYENRIREILRENLNQIVDEELLDEKTTAGSFTVYHRTRNPDPKTYNKGFEAGSGAMYGKGLYTTYDIESQKAENMRQTYGKYIIKFEIKDLKKFIILDKSVQYKVFGKEKHILEQLKSVMGGFYNEFIKINRSRLINLGMPYQVSTGNIDNSGGQEITSSDAYILSHCTGFIQHVDGLVFTGKNDGKVALIYNSNLANPIQYTEDEGETWKNIKDITSHKIGRDTRSGDKNLHNIGQTAMDISKHLNDYKFMDELFTQQHPSEIAPKIPENKIFDFLNVYAEHTHNNKRIKLHGLEDMMLKLPANEFKIINDKLSDYYKITLNRIVLQYFNDPETIKQIFGNNAISNLKPFDIFQYLVNNLNRKAIMLLGVDNLNKLDTNDLNVLKNKSESNPNKFVYNTLEDIISNKENSDYNQYYRKSKRKDLGLDESINIKKILREGILTKSKPDITKVADFVNFTKKYLDIDDDIKVALAYERTPDIKTSAYYNLDGFVKVYVKDRAIMDICRSIAHELTHHKQNLDGRLTDTMKDGEDGSDLENEANAKAGEIIRKWGKLNPELYQ